jgi:hypothetical protein
VLTRTARIGLTLSLTVMVTVLATRIGLAQGSCRLSCEVGETRDIHACCIPRKRPKRREAPTAPPPPATASLLVTANDPDAEVWIDDSRIAQVPAIAPSLKPGVVHHVVVRHGAAEWTKDVLLAAGVSERIEGILPRATVAPPAHTAPPEAPIDDTPPSPTLERAIRLYDAGDYYSASIELQKVLDSETPDGALGKQRAEFLLAMTSFQMRFYVSAIAGFDKIAQAGPSHHYYRAVLTWFVSLSKVLESPEAAPSAGAYPDSVLDEAIFDDIRDQLRYLLGMQAIASRYPDQAVAVLSKISSRSPYAKLAALELAKLSAATGDQLVASGHLRIAAEDLKLAVPVILELATWSSSPITDELFATLSVAGEPVSSLARLEHARRAAAVVKDLSPPGFYALALGTVCVTGDTDDLLAASKPLRDEIRALAQLTSMEDNADLYEAFDRQLEQPGSPMRGAVVAIMNATDPELGEQLRWLKEIEAENAAYERTDRAWRATRAASELYMEIVTRQAVAKADVGRLLRIRLGLLVEDVGLLEEGAPTKLSAGARGTLVVTDAACAAVASKANGRSGALAIRARGCCDASDSPPWTLILSLPLVVASIRRRAQRAQRKPTN